MSNGEFVNEESPGSERVVILGAGVVGLIVAASMATRGVQVDVLCREDAARAIRTRGLEIREQNGDRWHSDGVRASSDIGELASGPADLVVFSSKTFDTPTLLAQWQESGGSLTRCLSLQNTVQNEEILAQRFSETAGAVVRIGGDLVEPGVVAARDGRRVQLGMWSAGPTDWLDTLVARLMRSGVGASRVDDLQSAKFTKLVLNLDSALTAITGRGVNQVGDRDSVAIRRSMREEAIAVANAEGVALGDLPDIEVTDVPAVALGFASTWHDLERRRGRTETPWLNGTIVELGNKHGLRTPANAVLTALLAEAAEHRLAPGTSSPDKILATIRDQVGL